MLLKQAAFVMGMWETQSTAVISHCWDVQTTFTLLHSSKNMLFRLKFYKYGSTGHKVYAKHFCGHVEKHKKIDNFPLPGFIHIKAITSGKGDGNRKIIVSAEKVCTLAWGGFRLVQKKANAQIGRWEHSRQIRCKITVGCLSWRNLILVNCFSIFCIQLNSTTIKTPHHVPIFFCSKYYL